MLAILKMTFAMTFVVSTLALSSARAQEDASYDASFSRSNSCSARAIDRFYCPSFGGDQFQGPYFDNGCSVKCSAAQKAVCKEATCEDDQSGQPIDSSCVCK